MNLRHQTIALTLVVVAIVFAALLSAPQAKAVIITIEPDDFAEFTDLTDAIPGVTLVPVPNSGEPRMNLDDVEAITGSFTSTGSRVFGRQISSFSPDDSWFETEIDSVVSLFRASFNVPTDFVSIDMINKGFGTFGTLRAFDSTGSLLDTVTVDLDGVGTFATASISRPSNDISFILAAGPVTTFVPALPIALDNLRFNAPESIPEPTTLALFALGLAGLGLARRRRVGG